MSKLVDVIHDKNSRINELRIELLKYKKAIHNISPWLSASLSDNRLEPCQKYIDDVNSILELDVLEDEPIYVKDSLV